MIRASGFWGVPRVAFPMNVRFRLRDCNQRCDANLLYDATLKTFNRDAKQHRHQYQHTRDLGAKVAERLRNRLQSDTIPVRIRTLAYFKDQRQTQGLNLVYLHVLL